EQASHLDDVRGQAAAEVGLVDGYEDASAEIVEPGEFGKAVIERTVQHSGQRLVLALLVVVERLEGEPGRGRIEQRQKTGGLASIRHQGRCVRLVRPRAWRRAGGPLRPPRRRPP